MIRPLRIHHRRIFTLLGVLLPVAFGLGIAARKPVPEMSAVPAGLNPATPQFTSMVWERNDVFTNAPVQVRLLQGGGRFAIACTGAAGFAKPDLLVYWSAGGPPNADALPNDAVLLGGFSSIALPLPAAASDHSGVLILFSLADNEVFTVSRPIHFNPSAF